jgi:hypothetical protein
MKSKSPAAARRQRQAAQEEIEFLEAMERYCHEHGRTFPTWSEVLEVLRSLGYSKKKIAKASEANGDQQQLCAELKAERDRLQRELVALRDNYDQVKTAVGILMQEDDDVDIDELIAQTGQGPSLGEFVAALEAEWKATGAL